MRTERTSSRIPPRAWRAYSRRDGREIQRQLRWGRATSLECPLCGEVLEARPGTRLTRELVLDAWGYDLDCRDCRRFWTIVIHTDRSLRLIRMRRLVAAVRAVRLEATPAAAD